MQHHKKVTSKKEMNNGKHKKIVQIGVTGKNRV